ncbi:XdhC family protein [Dyella sp. ASV21]|uniref:XdhC family protein n=1 Tax=Dyella sp. ASV21 TaxID=2795114 RepID=UPI0018EA365D|nr:XdhC family protein [Dyella sp. ASV21]
MNVAQEFQSLYRAARSLDLRRDPGAAALVTITRTRGSTFRRAGASMLVLRDGGLVCELSGGCPQRDIVLHAHQAMKDGQPTLVAYGRDSNYDVMIETGCGGELEVFIEPWSQPEDLQFLDAIAQLREQRQSGTMASVFAVDGMPLARRPQRLVHGGNHRWSNIESAALGEQVLATTLSTASSTAAVVQSVQSQGRRYDVLLEALHPPHALVIIGDSIGAQTLAQLSFQLGWHTTLVSTRRSEGTPLSGIHHLVASPQALVEHIAFDSTTSAVVMTHRLDRDLAYLGPLLATPLHYVGVIGSRQRAAQIRAAFPHADERLHVPAGLDVGSETPQEIALAIAAEVLATRNGRSGGSLKQSRTAIHP